MKNKFFAILLALSLTLVFAACGSDTEATVETGSNVAVITETTTGKQSINAVKANVGDVIDITPLKMTLDAIEVKDKFEFSAEVPLGSYSYTSKYDISPSSGMTLICLHGDLTNKTSSEVFGGSFMLNCKFVVDGNSYSSKMQFVNLDEAKPVSTLAAQQTLAYFLYAEVPSDLANSFTNCTINIGIDDELDSSQTTFSEIEDMDFVYTIDYSRNSAESGTQLRQDSNGDWCLYQNGSINTDFTGIASNDSGSWYVQQGKVNFNFSGQIVYNGTTYNIENGKVVK